MNRFSVLLSLSVTACAAAGPNVGPPVAAESLCDELAEVLCTTDADCCPSASSTSTCMAAQRTRCEESLGVLLADPRAGYVPARGGYLLRVFTERASDCWAEPFQLAELDVMFEGTGVSGADCSPNAATSAEMHLAALSCVDGTACRVNLGWDDAAVGTCEAPEIAGASACSHPFDCGEGTFCNLSEGWRAGDWGTCQPLRTDGWSCRQSYECESGYCGPSGCAERPEAERCLRIDYGMLVLGDAPLAYYRLGERSGRAVSDSSSMGNDAMYVEPVMHEADGALSDDENGALVLDGMGGHLEAGELDGLGPDAITVELWVSREMDGEGGPLVELNGSDASVRLVLDTGRLVVTFLVDGEEESTELATAATAVGEGYHHVALSYGNEVTRLYVDGVEAAMLAGERLLPTEPALLVGFHEDADPDAASSLVGALDELAIYPEALGAGTLLTHVTAGREGPLDNEPVLFAWSR